MVFVKLIYYELYYSATAAVFLIGAGLWVLSSVKINVEEASIRSTVLNKSFNEKKLADEWRSRIPQ